MLAWLENNFSSIIVALILLATIVFIVVKMVRDKKAGRSSDCCGGDCGSCKGCYRD